jgi:putative transposase
LRHEFAAHIRQHQWGEQFWSPSYFAGSCGGAPLSTIKDYIEQQKRPSQRPTEPAAQDRIGSSRS